MAPKITPRRSEDRGHTDLGWLDARYTFSFDTYRDHNFAGFGALQVLNEDIIKPGKGFGKHDHEEFEIFTYMLSGELRHQDSMGNTETIRRGDIQLTTSGPGITHSETNASSKKNCKLLQIWTQPSGDGTRLPVTYHTKRFPDALKLNRLLRVIAPVGEADPETEMPLHADVSVYACLLEPGMRVGVVAGRLEGGRARRAYVHVVMGSDGELLMQGQEGEIVLGGGDGAFVTGWRAGEEMEFEARGEKRIEFLVFDLA